VSVCVAVVTGAEAVDDGSGGGVVDDLSAVVEVVQVVPTIEASKTKHVIQNQVLQREETDREVERDRQVERETDRQMERETDRRVRGQTDRERQTDRWSERERQTDGERDRQKS